MTGSFKYCEPPDVPEGMTLGEWRRERARARKAERRGRLRRRPKARRPKKR